MKLKTIALASIFAIGPTTLALAQGYSAGAEVPEEGGAAVKGRSGSKDVETTGSARSSRSTGSAVTTGSNVPQDKPNLSNSPASSDTSKNVK